MIIFQQGAPKSASSFCSQLLREIADQNGFTQEQLRSILGKRYRGGFVAQISSINSILNKIPDFSVIKTHSQPFSAEPLLRQNRAIGFVTLRDPLDSVRSLMDHADTSRNQSKNEFSEVTTCEEAGRIILLHLAYSLMWLRNPNVHPVYYNDLRTRPQDVAVMMAEKLNLKVDINKITNKYSDTNKIRRFNVGERGRGKKLLSSDDQTQLIQMFSIFYNNRSWVNDI